MASADFLPYRIHIAMNRCRLGIRSSRCQLYRKISQSKSIHFPLMCPLHLRSQPLYSVGLLLVMQHRPAVPASYAVSVRKAENLPQASFRFHLTVDTLAFLANTSHYQACSGLAPYSELTCLAHIPQRATPSSVARFQSLKALIKKGQTKNLPLKILIIKLHHLRLCKTLTKLKCFLCPQLSSTTKQ
jgi:hypothetical protein